VAAIVKPSRQASFSDLARTNPRSFPFDRLDSQIENLIQAINSTQKALEDIRRDDGRLKNASVGKEQLQPNVAEAIANAIAATTAQMTFRSEQAAAKAHHAGNEVALYARDAEAAAVSAAQFMNAVHAAADLIARNKDLSVNAQNEVETHTTDAENWANYSQIHAQNATAEQQQAAAWAEYLAGPVVDQTSAPAYIQSTPFGHGLYYQPVEGYGGTAGLWSAKWWAIYAAQLVGPWSFYYLGGWQDPPVPGSSNPDTGIKVPAPIPPGSFYFDYDAGTIYVWNGTEWVSPYALAAGVVSRFLYLATANQTVFTGQDYNGATPVVGQSPSDVHLNGVRLVEILDYTIAADTLTLLTPATVNSVIQWDLLVSPDSLAPGAVHSFKVTLTPAPDGVVTAFTMTYNDPVNGLSPVNATVGAQMQVSVDGIVQEPGADYTAAGDTLTMSAAPLPDSRFWAIWFANEVLIAS
jgi:hypothetical protein